MSIVGIDLGTTNSLVGAWTEDEAVLFEDEGEVLLPSAVSLGARGELLVGRAARNRRLVAPHDTITSVKRMMGRETRLSLGGRQYSPSEVSALILGALLDRVEASLGERPASAIITVPAYFDDNQRQATRDAGELAGLEVERLVNEPTAAAMGYDEGSEELVLVYDLGGGTFDVSILEREEELLEVLTSHGDTKLGGDDIDEALLGWLVERLGKKGAQLKADPVARVRALELLERAKINLSDREELTLFDPLATEDLQIELPLTRADLEAVAEPLIRRTLSSVDRALRDAKVEAEDLDRVLLVGGATRMPLVARLLSEHLGRPAQADLDPDRAVALGATMLAGRAAGGDVRRVLVDITPHTLAAGAMDDEDDLLPRRFETEDLLAAPVIPRGTVVPTARTRTFYTAVPNQAVVSCPVTQGEGSRVGENVIIGELSVADLPPSPIGSPVEVTFRLDLSGVLEVEGRHVPSGKVAKTTIANSPFRLSARERAQGREALAELRERVPKALSRTSQADVKRAEAMLASSTRAIERANQSGADPDAVDAAIRARADLARKLEAREDDLGEAIDALSDALLDLL